VPWPSLIKEETFVADGSEKLILPQRVSTLVWAGDKTNKSDIKPARFWDKEFPASFFGRTSGKAEFWRPMGNVAVVRDLTYGKINVITTVSDTTTVYLEGLTVNSDASGTADAMHYISEEVLVTGNVAVQSTNDFYSLDTIGKDDYTSADFVIWDASSNVLARLRAKATRCEYQKIEFIHKPTAGTEIWVQYLANPQLLISNNQVPHTSVDIDYLIWYAAANMHDAQGQAQEAELKRTNAERILNRKIHKLKSHGDRDFRVIPEFSYWNFDDDYEVGQ
jgi:hypothetical protein